MIKMKLTLEAARELANELQNLVDVSDGNDEFVFDGFVIEANNKSNREMSRIVHLFPIARDIKIHEGDSRRKG